MAITDIADVSIVATTSAPSAANFGIALLAVNKVPTGFVNRVRLYGSLKEMTDAGWLVTDPGYIGALDYFSQTPRPKSIKIGRRANKTVQSLQLTVLSAVTGEIHTLTVAGVPLTYTVPGSSTTTTVATALELLIEAVAGVDSTSSAAVITFGPTGATPGVLIDVADWSRNLSLKDVSADPGLGPDLIAIQAEDDDWYGLALDSNSKAEVLAAAAFIEPTEKLFGYSTVDTEVSDNTVTTDVMSSLKALAYSRTYGIFDANRLLGFSALAWMGDRFAGSDPGADTWAYKTLIGVKVDDQVTAAQRNAILSTPTSTGKNGNIYSLIENAGRTENGKVASGEWIDTIRFLDWLRSILRTGIAQLLFSNPKIPYTDTGIEAVVNVVKGALSRGVKVGGLADDIPYVVTAPTSAEVDPATRAQRLLPNVEFSARLAGAIHIVEIRGSVSS